MNMGLDVYLYSRTEQVANEAHEKAWDEWYEKYHDGEGTNRPEFTEEERETAKKAIPSYVMAEQVPSQVKADHLFNRRYLRSSYNESGFNRAVPDMVGQEHSLYWIFEPVRLDDQYEIELTTGSLPALAEAKERALQVAQEIRESDPIRATDAGGMIGPAEHMWHSLPSPEQVLDWFREEQADHKQKLANYAKEGKEPPEWIVDGGYTNAKGHILGFTKGLEILAATAGVNVLGQPTAILIYRLPEETRQDYVDSALITAEFCQEAMDLIERDGSCAMSWSG